MLAAGNCSEDLCVFLFAGRDALARCVKLRVTVTRHGSVPVTSTSSRVVDEEVCREVGL